MDAISGASLIPSTTYVKVQITLNTVAAVFVAVRITTNRLTAGRFFLDDYMSVVALIFLVSYSTSSSLMTKGKNLIIRHSTLSSVAKQSRHPSLRDIIYDDRNDYKDICSMPLHGRLRYVLFENSAPTSLYPPFLRQEMAPFFLLLYSCRDSHRIPRVRGVFWKPLYSLRRGLRSRIPVRLHE
jgi:hypothetical protein